jgi:hypothetical protein
MSDYGHCGRATAECKRAFLWKVAMNASEQVLVRLVGSVSLLLSLSAAIILLVVMPFAFLQHWHLLPNWQGLMFIYLLFPVVIAWNHAGIAFVLIVVVCELILLRFDHTTQRMRLEAVVKVSVCALALLFLTVGNRLNFH